MSDTKTYVFGNDGNNGYRDGFGTDFLTGALLGGGGGFGGFGGGANWLLPFLLFALWGNNGWGGFGGFGNRNGFNGGCGNAAGFGFISDQLNNDAGRELIMQAIQGNANAIGQLSTTLNCSIGELRTALNGISGKICDVANQVGMSSLQVINSITSGNAALASQLASCCCDLKSAIKDCCCDLQRDIATTNSGLERGFSSLAYESQAQTCAIEKAIANSTETIVAGQRAAEMREMQDKIDALREKNAQQAVILNNAQQTATFGQMLAPIQADLAELKCNQVPVKKIACPEQYIPVNASVNATYGLIPTCNYNSFGGWGWNGWNNGWNNGCCGNSLWG